MLPRYLIVWFNKQLFFPLLPVCWIHLLLDALYNAAVEGYDLIKCLFHFFLRFYFSTWNKTKQNKTVNFLSLIQFYPSHLQSEEKWVHWIPPSECLTTEDEQNLILCYYLAYRKVYRTTSYWPFQVKLFKNSMVVGSLEKSQHEPFRKCTNACT